MTVTTTQAPAPKTPLRAQFIERNQRSKQNVEHIGRSNSIQTLYDHSGPGVNNERWAPYTPATLPQARRQTKEQEAPIIVYKRPNASIVGPERFSIVKVRLQSPYLRDALKDTLATYGMKYDENNLSAESYYPHRALYYAGDRVAELAETAADELTRKHCGLLYGVIEEIFAEDGKGSKINALFKEKKITFDLLWVLFPEGHIFATQWEDGPVRCYRVKSIQWNTMSFRIYTESVAFDGYHFGTVADDFIVYFFVGEVDFTDIPGLTYFDVEEDKELRTRLMERGRRALEMQTVQYMALKPSTGNSETVHNPLPWKQVGPCLF